MVTALVLSAAGANAMTRSPTATSSTAAPIERTIPAHSRPKAAPAKPSISASSGSNPNAHIRSRKLTPAARTSISTSFRPIGFGLRTSQSSDSSPPGWLAAKPSAAGPAARCGGRPRRTRGTCRPIGVRTISLSAPSAAISRAICRTRSAGGTPLAKSSRRSESRGISLIKTRAKPQRAPPIAARSISPGAVCCASQVTTQSVACRCAASEATRASTASCCAANSTGGSSFAPSARSRIIPPASRLPPPASSATPKPGGCGGSTRCPAEARRASSAALNILSPPTRVITRGSIVSSGPGSGRGGAIPQNIAVGQGAAVIAALPPAANPAAASSACHSPPVRSGDLSPAGHHPVACPRMMSQNGVGSGSAPRKIPPGASRSPNLPSDPASSRRRALALTAMTMSKDAGSRPSSRSFGDHWRAAAPTNDSASNDSSAACSASTLVAR